MGFLSGYAAEVDNLSCSAQSECLVGCAAPVSLCTLCIATDRLGHSEQRLICDKAGLLAIGLFAVWLSSSVLMMTNSSGMSTCNEAGEA